MPFVHVLYLAADHHGNQRVQIHILYIHRIDVLSVTHNGDTVPNALDLVHTVRDIYDRHIVSFQLFHNLEQLIDLTIGQG